MSTEIGRFLLPMRLERLDDGRYIALNRYYKPVGSFSRERVSYETSTSAFRFARQITEQDAINLSFRGESDLNAIVLYDETTNPHRSPDLWLAYMRRLDYLANLLCDGAV